eukprot:6314216-Lingulodinium_polyedra.AAC.1
MARQLVCPAPLPRVLPIGCVRRPQAWEEASEAAAALEPADLEAAWQKWLSCAEREHLGRLGIVGEEAAKFCGRQAVPK